MSPVHSGCAHGRGASESPSLQQVSEDVRMWAGGPPANGCVKPGDDEYQLLKDHPPKCGRAM